MRVLVTGGAGFLGSHIAAKLVARGDDVVSLQRSAVTATSERMTAIAGDIASPEVMTEAAKGCDAVIHVAAKAGVWGSRESYERPNVLGTENVIAACLHNGVQKLIYTSTPSVVHTGGDIEGGDESLPYAEHFATHYPETKAVAERAVLRANGLALSTTALRPHLIWGPGDPHLCPRVVQRAKAGRLRLVDGGQKRVDAVYVDNAADAHINALDRLGPEAACAGRAYFITNDEPLLQRDLINGFLRAAGLPECTKSVSRGVASAAGGVLESLYKLVGATSEPPMTRFVAEQLATAHWYCIDAARRDLGYSPQVTMSIGFERLAASLAAT
jgi:nucleoside-diphosphate-sugar epimerase